MTTYDSLFEQIHTSANLLHRGAHFARKGQHMQEDAAPLHRGQGRVLHALLQRDGIAQKELVELLDIRPSSVGELVDKLEQAGLVRRSQGEEDKRVSLVHLTDTGRERITQMQTGREELMASLLSGLTAEEQETLEALLTKLNDSLKQRYPTAPERQGQGCGGPGPHGFGGDDPRGCGGPHGRGHHPHDDPRMRRRHGCGQHGGYPFPERPAQGNEAD